MSIDRQHVKPKMHPMSTPIRSAKEPAQLPDYCEPHRPQLHFSPARNWINDPNGLVHFNGVFHLFYQYNPTGTLWGNMHWGHATSADLVHWQEQKLALSPEPSGLGYVFSGCVVIDEHNTSGFQRGELEPLVALFTHSSASGTQVQSLAFSTDAGDSWHMYDRNPVLPNPGVKDFRDPKVFWHEPTQRWVMALAAGDRISIYTSVNLLQWSHRSDFGPGLGSSQGVWECPDLLRMQIEDTGEYRWVLIVSVGSGAVNEGSGIQYFIGEFDGVAFRAADGPDGRRDEVLWLDHGPDNYAGITWVGVPPSDGRHLLISWMNNWQYAPRLPTSPWRGAMTLPRELRLTRTRRGLRVANEPIVELKRLRQRSESLPPRLVNGSEVVGSELSFVPTLVEIELSFDWHARNPDRFGITFGNTQGDELVVHFSPGTQQLIVDRSNTGSSSIGGQVAATVIEAVDERLELRLFLDVSSLEAFANAGTSSLTVNHFPNRPLQCIEIFSVGEVEVKTLTFHLLRSIWADRQQSSR